MAKYTLSVNNKAMAVEADPDTPLLWVLRDNLNLVGTKYGCGIAQCGACTVHINGTAVRSCQYPVAAVQASKVTTIEGLSATGTHPLQLAWEEMDVAQCGYCQSGQIMAAASLLKTKPNPTDDDIDKAMTNICRCGTHFRIRKAIHLAANNKTTKSAKS
ncbi:(2Fe-2S)-binding protein [Mucilaginibacter sp. HMF5004]|uniref:(2Fe-2S)-binding protein n=1 Tax=Mucilaginibacter rivuli TaxID=2857527 RepID=UPI001C5D147B|nr:(2Fe-2S)-binding protein [Mucilaginibacter rivuli]MBW4891925.1 (2Fe-2S)-binding protein [Mucilaginibacter rivuli]